MTSVVLEFIGWMLSVVLKAVSTAVWTVADISEFIVGCVF